MNTMLLGSVIICCVRGGRTDRQTGGRTKTAYCPLLYGWGQVLWGCGIDANADSVSKQLQLL